MPKESTPTSKEKESVNLTKLMNKLDEQEKKQNEKFNKLFEMVIDLKSEVGCIRDEH